MKNLHRFIHYIWFEHPFLFWVLLPLSLLYGAIVWVRRSLYRCNYLKSYQAKLPVVVIGNLTVGGNGKTPMVIWLVNQLHSKGIRVGVITRGYGSKAPYYPLLVSDSLKANETGDEPLLIHLRTGAPVVLSPNRQEAIELLLTKDPTLELIISDDGLQHYALKRDLEWVVMDATKQFGNHWWLPAGPMRESIHRLKEIDAVIINHGASMPLYDPKNASSIIEENIAQIPTIIPSKIPVSHLALVPLHAVNLKSKKTRPITDFKSVIAIAGIGFPARFFNLLTTYYVKINQQVAFPDHHAFTLTDLSGLANDDTPIMMTEKDAMKCFGFAQDNWWYLPIDGVVADNSAEVLLTQIDSAIAQFRL